MNKIIIKTIKINNFKGIKSLEMAFKPTRTVIKGENGAGKTSIKLAYQWCLGQNVGEIIPTKQNKEIKGLETRVELILEINGSDYTIVRTRTDSIDKNTGNKKGNDFTYAVDNIDMKESQFKSKLAQLVGNGTLENLNILTDNEYFNTDTTSWKWNNRRAVLFNMCDVATKIKDIIEEEKYSGIKDNIIKGTSTTDLKKQLTSDKKALQDKQQKNVYLIEDTNASIRELEEIDFEELKKERAKLEKEFNKANTEIASKELEKLSTELYNKTQELSLLEKKKLADQNKIRNEAQTLYNESRDLYTAYNIQIRDLDAFVHQREDIANTKVVTECYVCHRELPKDQIEETKEKLKLELADFDERIADRQRILTETKEKYTEKKALYEAKNKELQKFDTENCYQKDINDTKEAIKDLESAIETEKTTNLDTLSSEKKQALQGQINAINVELAKETILRQQQEKLAKLQTENKDYAKSIIEIEDKLKQIAEFVKEQVSITTNIVNNKFKNGITWALYNETYKNGEGGLEETCVCLYNGKTYQSLSNGERAVSNLEVAKVLREYFNSLTPLFVDNAETITIPYETNTQIIELFAEKGAKIENAELFDKK